MTTGEIVVAVLTSSAFTGLLVEILRALRSIIERRKNKGLAKVENDIKSIKDKTLETGEKVIEIQEELARQKETDMVLLHDRIWDVFNRLQNEKYISVEDKANLEYLYDEYRSNNGNHQAEIMFNYIEKKPLKTEEETRCIN